MHFFSPVHKMPLLEVDRYACHGARSDCERVAYGRKLGKTVIS